MSIDDYHQAIESKVQARPPLNAGSSAQLITGVTFPLPNNNNSSELSGEARFGYLFNSSSSAVSGDKDGNDAADEAVRAFRLVHQSGANQTALLKASVALLSTQVTKVLRLETDVEPGKPLQAYGLDSLSAVERHLALGVAHS
ncbi:hypothetical protein F5Y08DRAFT_332398 [Xylaria arbuscula]|nr:hypothetical protein F5Y08DRAFT_332398 [Xylaria arbuscula]